MELDLTDNSLPVYEALANRARLEILRTIGEEELNISQLAERLYLSKAIVTKHVQQLERAGLVKSCYQPGTAGRKKLPHLAVDTVQIHLPKELYLPFYAHTSSMPIGHYTAFEVAPTCGLATVEAVVGSMDDPRAFVDPNRTQAALLWFTQGFVEYKIPNLLQAGQRPELLEVSMELASEFPASNNIWPSDMSFYINDVPMGVWTCPGNFSDVRGFYTPAWWGDSNSQYGLLKHLRVHRDAASIDGEALSEVGLGQLCLEDSQFITLRIEVKAEAAHCGGATLFGRGFGNHDQDIVAKLYYSE